MRRPRELNGDIVFIGRTGKMMRPAAENEVRFHFKLYDEITNSISYFTAVLTIVGYDVETETLILAAYKNSGINIVTAASAAKAFLRHTGSIATAKNYLGLNVKEVVRNVQIILVEEETSITMPKHISVSGLKAQG